MQGYLSMIYNDPVLFHVTLQLSALHLEKISTRRDLRQTKGAMSHCLRLLRMRIEASTTSREPVADQTVSAVAGLAAIEVGELPLPMIRTDTNGLSA